MEDLTLMPDHLRNWRERRVQFTPYERDDDGELCLWFENNDNIDMPIAAKSELMVITGREKSRKTLLLQCMIMSNYIKDLNKTLRFKMDLGGGPILFFDTEQPIRRTKKNHKRFYNICGLSEDDPNYQMFNIRSLTFNQKLEFITHTITEVMEEFGKPPGLVAIDQVADLLPARDVNDSTGVDLVYSHISQWQQLTQEQSLFAVVIHTNRGGINTNGKLGVMLDQKTDTSFHVEIDFDNFESTVTHKLARDKRIPKFTFRQDYDGAPRLLSVKDLNTNHI